MNLPTIHTTYGEDVQVVETFRTEGKILLFFFYIIMYLLSLILTAQTKEEEGLETNAI